LTRGPEERRLTSSAALRVSSRVGTLEAQGPENEEPKVSFEGPKIAFVCHGKLYLHSGVSGEGAVAVESTFAEDVRRREDESLRRKAWKSEGPSAFFSGLAAAAREPALAPGASLESLAPGRTAGEILYTLRIGALGGLFCYDSSLDRESRIHHGRENRISDLSRPGPDGSVACSVHSANGARHLAPLRGDGFDEKEVTEGDSRDEAPSWSNVPGPRGGKRTPGGRDARVAALLRDRPEGQGRTRA
jgi:hypothetical protein